MSNSKNTNSENSRPKKTKIPSFQLKKLHRMNEAREKLLCNFINRLFLKNRISIENANFFQNLIIRVQIFWNLFFTNIKYLIAIFFSFTYFFEFVNSAVFDFNDLYYYWSQL